MKGDNTMEADRYRRELERKDRDISSVDEAIERIFAEEKRCQDVIDQRTRDLRNCKSESIIETYHGLTTSKPLQLRCFQSG